jgi:hypothetical protein
MDHTTNGTENQLVGPPPESDGPIEASQTWLNYEPSDPRRELAAILLDAHANAASIDERLDLLLEIYTRFPASLDLFCEQLKTHTAVKPASLIRGIREYQKALNQAAFSSSAPIDIRPSQKNQLLELAPDFQLFCSPDDRAYVTLPIGHHYETHRLQAGKVRAELMTRYKAEYSSAPGPQAVQDALDILEGEALVSGQKHPVHVRLAPHEGNIIIDLGNDQWDCLQITPHGWTILDTSPVKFRRPKGMEALPYPEAGGSIYELRPFVNVATDADFILVVSWLLGAYHPAGPYPILVVHGQQGSAKSSLTRVLRKLIDPYTPLTSRKPDKEHNLFIAANNQRVLAFDNLTYLPVWLSDAMCVLSTGGGYRTRTLFENDEETIFDAIRPQIMNGLEEIATRSDLLERCILLHLPKLVTAKPEKEFWKDFYEAQPRILGALCTAVQGALYAMQQGYTLSDLSRMADFELWACAATAELPWNAQAFRAAYYTNQHEAHFLALENAPIVPAIQSLISHAGTWEGLAVSLLEVLQGVANEQQQQQRGWPKAANVLTRTLRRLAPNLHAIGVQFEDLGHTAEGRMLRLSAVSTSPEESA